MTLVKMHDNFDIVDVTKETVGTRCSLWTSCAVGLDCAFLLLGGHTLLNLEMILEATFYNLKDNGSVKEV